MDTDKETTSQFDLLLLLTRKEAKSIALELLLAAARADLRVAVFLTGGGASLAAKTELGGKLSSLTPVVASAVVCTESWRACDEPGECGVETGSQTNHSQMVANAAKVISL